MKVLHIVTLVSPNGEYGGPVQVALNQASAMEATGVSVTVAGGERGWTQTPHEVQGVEVRLFRARTTLRGLGFAGLISPGLYWWLFRHARRYDVAHVHLARDLVTLPATLILRILRVPYVTQTHGMVDATSRKSGQLLDVLITRRALGNASVNFYLTPQERSDLELMGLERSLTPLRNGIASDERVSRTPSTSRQTVIFLARMHERKRPLAFTAMAQALRHRGSEADFLLIGADEGLGEPIRKALKVGADEMAGSSARGTIRWLGSMNHQDATDFLKSATLSVLPSINEPYPMAILEALSLGVPVVITESCGLADVVSQGGCGLVVSDSLTDLTDQVEYLLSDTQLLSAMSQRAQHVASNELGMGPVVDSILDAYGRAVAR